MNYFSNRTMKIITSVTIAALVLSAALLLFSSQLIDFTYTILSSKVFHREFSIEKWLPSINSFFLVPMFMVICLTAVFFFKYPPRFKIILLSTLLGVLAFMIAYTTLTTSHMHVNGDTSSELWLGKECLLQHTFWPRTWFYSTELRLIYTQIFTTIGFLFTDSWNGVKMFQSLCCCAVLFFAMWYLLNQLHLKSFWLKFFVCILSIMPWSTVAWYVGAGWTYYIPHAAISLVYVATYIKIVCNKNFVNHQKTLIAFFYCWAFVAGLSSIRYILIFVFPLTISMIIIEARDKNRKAEIWDLRKFWIENNAVFHSVAGLFASGFGYIANNLVLQRIWSFSEWNTQGYNTFGSVSFMDIWGGIIRIFGYQDQIAVFSPNGLLNMLVYVALIMLITFMVSTVKSDKDKAHTIVLVFFTATMTFNIFQYIHVDFITRYFYPVIIYIFPVLAILLDNACLTNFKRYLLGVSWGILVCTSSFSVIQNQLTTDQNKDKYPVLAFLQANDYDFGYGTYWETTAITYLSNGEIQMGNLYKKKADGHVYITDSYKYDNFETPSYIYSDENHKDKKVFLMVTQDQYEIAPDMRIFKTGELVYSDDNYRIYNYENHGAFKKGF